MTKTLKLLFQIIIYPVVGILFISCESESSRCVNYDLNKVYSLQNFISDTETLEKINNSYIDNNKSQLDNAFDGAGFVTDLNKMGYFIDRIHFKLNFENNSTGFFQDSKDNVSLRFNFKYFQDSVVVLNCENDYEYQLFINDECKLEHCVFLVSTLENFEIEKYKTIYTTYCQNKTYMDVANELLLKYGSDAPDTIGINKYILKEDK